MNKFKVLHTGDIHLQSPMSAVGEVGDLRRHELLLTFGRIIDLAKSEKVDALIIAGDLFDNSDVSAPTQNYIEKKFNEISDIPVFITLGNHDFAYKNELPKNVHVFKDYIEKISLDNADIYGVSFAGEYCEKCNIEGFTVDDKNKINIMALHCDLISKGQLSKYNPITINDICQSGADYFALGHVHKFSGINSINEVSYAYCGIPEGRGFDETGEKGVIIADVYKNHVGAKFVPVCAREHMVLDVDISMCVDYNEIYDKIIAMADNTQNLYKIVLSGETEAFVDLDMLIKMLSDKYFYIKIKDNTKPKIDIVAVSKEHNLTGLFVRNIIENGNNENALKYGLMALKGEKVHIE